MAGQIPRSFIDELLARTDIVDVISSYVPLKKRGREYIACCPFHDEKTPSFSVSADKQFYHCFGCGVNGSAIKFLMEYQHLGFVEAIEQLAEHIGLQVPYAKAEASYVEKNKTTLQILDKLAGLYAKQLNKNQAVLRYLEQRGLDEETTTKFKLGYAADGFDNVKLLLKGDYNESLLLEAGIVSKKNNNVYARFRNRLMFPIRNSRGHTIAFGGRILSTSSDDHSPKYLNSPETAVFQKRETLYGIYELSKGTKLNSILVVEGYMDVISLARHGITNTVATLGTAITKEHVQRLFRLCKELIFCFDGDTAGYKAAEAALKQSLTVFRDGCEIKFMLLPQDDDPDTLVRKEGVEKFKQRINQSIPLSKFLFNTVSAGIDLSLPEGVAIATERARPLIASLPQGTFRDLILKKLAQELNVVEEHLLTVANPRPRIQRTHSPTVRHRHSLAYVASALLIKNPSLIDLALPTEQIMQLEKIDSNFVLLAELVDKIKTHGITTTQSLLTLYQDDQHEATMTQLLKHPLPLAPNDETEFNDCMKKIQENLLKERDGQRLRQLIAKKQGSLSDTEKQELRKLLAVQR